MKTEIEISLPESKLTQEQRQTHTATWMEGKNKHRLNVHLRYDDECGNGHNTFAITGELYINGRMDSCGCLHDEIAKYAPEFKQFIKWHLVSSDGPMHYVANTQYWVKEGNLENARDTAIWPEATAQKLSSELALKLRLPKLMEEFKQAMESLGFVY